MKIKITAKELQVAPNGFTVITAVAGDEIEIDTISGQSIIDAGFGVEVGTAAPAAKPEPTAPASGSTEPKTPEQMTKAELAAYAEEQGITLDATKTKAEMLEAFTAATAAK